jgi:uncharacterized protein (DUF2252 family)
MGGKPDIVAKIRKYNAGLEPERLRLKYAAMRQDAFRFFRGTCHLFYDRLPPWGSFVRAPAAWCCGDLHLENFGSYTGDNGLVYFDLNDFDEAILAPCVWDLIRLVASIRVARSSLKFPAAHATRLSKEVIDAYAQALHRGKPYWVERDNARGLIGSILATLEGRTRKNLLDRRTTLERGKRRIAIDGVRALAASAQERKFVRRLLMHFARAQPHPGFFRPVDVARRIAGTGSLGLPRYIILVAGPGGVDHMRLLDLKRARRSSSARRVDAAQPDWPSEAHRVIAVQTRCQAISPAFLAAIESDGASFVLRELQPREDRLDLAYIAGDAEGCSAVFRLMGSLLAWGQLRAAGRQRAAVADDLMTFAAKAKWRRRVLAVATEAADRSAADWRIYAKAYDAGELPHIR